MRPTRWMPLAFLLLAPAGFRAQNGKSSVVLDAMKGEMLHRQSSRLCNHAFQLAVHGG